MDKYKKTTQRFARFLTENMLLEAPKFNFLLNKLSEKEFIHQLEVTGRLNEQSINEIVKALKIVKKDHVYITEQIIFTGAQFLIFWNIVKDDSTILESIDESYPPGTSKLVYDMIINVLGFIYPNKNFNTKDKAP